MRILLCSDLHLDFYPEAGTMIKSLPDADLCIVAGDVANGPHASCAMLGVLAERYKKVLFVPGNHDFYGSTWVEGMKVFKDFEKKVENFSLLNVCEINGIRIMGATLWPAPVLCPVAPTNDREQIGGWDYLTSKVSKKDHQWLESLWLNRKIDLCVSHYAPLYSLVNPRYAGQLENEYFVHDCSDLLTYGTQNHMTWFFGHTHHARDVKYGDIRFISNPQGYPGECHKRGAPLAHTLLDL